VHATDPEAMSRARCSFPQVHYHKDPYDALRERMPRSLHGVGIFRKLDWDRAGKVMARKPGDRRGVEISILRRRCGIKDSIPLFWRE